MQTFEKKGKKGKKTKQERKIKLLIVCPHPDDGEAFVSQLGIQGIKAGWEVHQVLATCDEYGTPLNEFKGERIRRIRKHEMLTAQKRYGIDSNGKPLLKIHWMDYIDGYVPHNKAAVSRLQKFILKINPDVIIGPDPFIYCDGHVDHMAIGKNYFFALKQLKQEKRPKTMLFFQTLMPNFFLPKLFPHQIHHIREAHKSQWSQRMLRIVNKFNIITQISFQLKFLTIKSGKFQYVEGYRRVLFTNKDHIPKGLAKIFFYIFKDKPLGCEEGRLLPHPKQLGINLIPPYDIL
ncbi:MAG: PIG-L deacetylase family protein [Promethearchaeota archaeon]